jgi:hypothetical protein
VNPPSLTLAQHRQRLEAKAAEQGAEQPKGVWGGHRFGCFNIVKSSICPTTRGIIFFVHVRFWRIMLAGRLNGKSRPTSWRPPTNIGTPNLHPVRLLTAKVPELQTQDSFIALANYGKPGEIQGQHALQTRANWGHLLTRNTNKGGSARGGSSRLLVSLRATAHAQHQQGRSSLLSPNLYFLLMLKITPNKFLSQNL